MAALLEGHAMKTELTRTRSRAQPGTWTSLSSVGALCLLAAVAPGLSAHETGADAGEGTTTPLARQPLPDFAGKQLVLAVVSYAPGQSSAPHRHPGSVMAYVLEGEVISQLEGQPPITYRAGQSWYEPPLVPHLVSKNGSSTAPARLLAVLLLDIGAPTKEPLPR